jgi:putative ABC transport system substrate-binding protein
MSRNWRRAMAWCAAVVLLCACGSAEPGGGAADHVTVAFLRAVAGAPSTEPSFVAELRRAGFREGQNLTILAGDPNEAYSDAAAAAEAVARWEDAGVDLIMALSTSSAQVASKAAPDVDVLFLSNDPTASGLVRNEQRPDGRLTGVTFRVPADRTLSLARRAVPGLVRIGLASPPSDPAALANLDAVRAAAGGSGLELLTATFRDGADVAAAVDELAAQQIGALLVSTSPIASRAIPETIAAAADHDLPVIANTTLVDSAVLSLSPDTDELGRQLGRQAARLLGGASLADVPVEDPNRFIVTVNALTAAELGIALPADLLREANTVRQ